MEKTVIDFKDKKLNWDDDIDHIPLGDSRDRMDKVYPNGDSSVLQNRRELYLIAHTLPSGTNNVIGKCSDYENNAIILFICNSSNNDCIIRMYSDDTFQNISYAKDWGFSTSYYIHDAFIVGTGLNALLCFNDNYNPPRRVNITNLINGNYPNLKFNEINQYLPAPLYKPELTLGTDSTYDDNRIRGRLHQIAYSYINDLGQESPISPWSDILFDYKDSYDDMNFDATITNNNKISIQFKVGLSFITGDSNDTFENITKLNIYYKNPDIGVGQSGTWKLYDTVDLTDSEYYDNIYHYEFYNNRVTLGTDQTVFLGLQENIPLTARTMELLNDERIALGGLNRNYDNVNLDVNLSSVNIVSLDFLNYVTYLRTVPNSSSTVNVIDLDLKAPNGQGTILWEIYIQKIVDADNSIEGSEKYFYQFYTASTYSGYMSNSEVVTKFVNQINTLTGFDITAYSESGGHPHILRISIAPVASNTGKSYYACFIPKLLYPTLPSLKENTNRDFAICYLDKFGRRWNPQIKGLSLKIPYSVSGLAAGGHIAQLTINHQPPADAVAWVPMIADTEYPLFFVLPFIMDITTTKGMVADLEEDAVSTKLNYPQALARCEAFLENTDFNIFSPQAGDRIRILGKPYKLGSSPSGSAPKPLYYPLTEVIEKEILSVDGNGKLVISSLQNYDEYANFQYYNVYYIMIYRELLDIDSENLIYKEIGVPNPIVNGFHTVNTVDYATNGITPQNQTAYDGSGPAIVSIDFGDVYLRPVHFHNIVVYDNIVGTYADKYSLIPLFCYVPCKNVSFSYDSYARSTGRSDYYKDNYGNETVEQIVYSGILKNSTTNYNDLNRFRDDPYSDLNQKDGKIIKMRQSGYVLRVYQEKNIVPIYINRQLITDAAGNQTLQYSQNVLGDANPLNYNVGCTQAGSFASNHDNDYFADENNSAWYRFGQNGLMNITEANERNPNAFKMKAYGIYLFKQIASSLKSGNRCLFMSGFDPVKNMYIFTFIDLDTLNPQVTIGFHEPTNSWLSWYSIWHENYISFNKNRFFSFVGGSIYEHHRSTTYSTGYIQFHFNIFPTDRKLFKGIGINSDQIMAPTNQGDILIDENSVATQNPDSYEWNFAKMSSYLKENHFIVYEGEFRAIFKRNMLAKDGTIRNDTYLINGEKLRGKTISIRLRDSKTSQNTLRSITIEWEKSK